MIEKGPGSLEPFGTGTLMEEKEKSLMFSNPGSRAKKSTAIQKTTAMISFQGGVEENLNGKGGWGYFVHFVRIPTYPKVTKETVASYLRITPGR